MLILSMHDWLRESSLRDRRSWRVQATFDKAICFEAEGQLMTLTSICNGPATILAEWPLDSFSIGQRVYLDMLVNLEEAKLWFAPAFSIDPGGLSYSTWGHLVEVVKKAGKSPLLLTGYRDRLSVAVKCLHDDFPGVNRGAKLIIGLGPGLTPSGDDFLAGYCHTLYHGGIPNLWQELSAIAVDTNFVSKEMLRWACQGVVSSAWENAILKWVNMKNEPLDNYLDEALQIGHSSGSDYILGCSFGLYLLSNTGERPQDWLAMLPADKLE